MTAWRDRLAVLRARSEVSAEIYARDNSAISANRRAATTTAGAIGAIGPNVTGIDLAKRAAFLLRAAEDAVVALAGPERGPVLQVGQIDHDEGEREALVEHYAEPETVPPAKPGQVYCFPCGRPVLPRDRTWSEARGWCCATCCPVVAKVVRVLNAKQGEIPPDAVYIGRASRGRPASKWQNPFRIGPDGTRDECIAQYRVRLECSPLRHELGELCGRDLVCWCAPLACHGDLLLKLANPKAVR